MNDQYNDYPAERPTVPESERIAHSDPAHINRIVGVSEEYNRSFAPGMMLSRLIRGVLGAQTSGTSEPEEFFRDEDQAQAVSATEAIMRLHGALDATGLTLVPTSGRYGSIYLNGDQAGFGELDVQANDSRKFLEYVRGLEGEEARPTGAAYALERVSGYLAEQIATTYAQPDLPANGTALLADLGDVLGEYRRLGVTGQAVGRMGTYLERARSGDMREYIAIESAGLLHEPGQYFGPGDWQGDTSIEQFTAKWQEAIAITEATGRNPNASALFARTRTNLLNCIFHAQNRLRAGMFAYFPEHAVAKGKVLEDMRLRLLGMGYDPPSSQSES